LLQGVLSAGLADPRRHSKTRRGSPQTAPLVLAASLMGGCVVPGSAVLVICTAEGLHDGSPKPQTRVIQRFITGFAPSGVYCPQDSEHLSTNRRVGLEGEGGKLLFQTLLRPKGDAYKYALSPL